VKSKPTVAFRVVRKILARRANTVLRRGGLHLGCLQNDFDDRPLDDYTRYRMTGAMARAYETWVASQVIFRPAEVFDAGIVVNAFFASWLDTPFRDEQGGSRFNNLLWLHLIARSMQPDVIVDSGSFRGASAWALSLGSPRAQVFSFDVDLKQLALRVTGVNYIEADWSHHPADALRGARVLAYFDDHVDQVRRLIEAHDRSCQVAIFDDDFPVTSYFGMAPSPNVLPKVEFALDEELTDGQTLRWLADGVEFSFVIDRGYLDRGRSYIAATDRLPNTSSITGIHQTPYRIVALVRGDQGPS
jgi:hypothetical protein